MIEHKHKGGDLDALPDDWQLVPVHPTKEMRAAGAKINGQGWDFAHHTWRTMLLHAPAAPSASAQPAKLDADLLTTIREAAAKKAEGAITKDGRAVFINYGDSEQQMLDGAEMACPHCGGSGHKDDVRPVASPAALTLTGDEVRAITKAARQPGSDHPSGLDYVMATVAYLNRRAASPADQGEDARDAARYRWLRERHWNESTLFVVAGHHSLVRLGTDCPSDNRLDSAIDAAMSASKE